MSLHYRTYNKSAHHDVYRSPNEAVSQLKFQEQHSVSGFREFLLFHQTIKNLTRQGAALIEPKQIHLFLPK